MTSSKEKENMAIQMPGPREKLELVQTNMPETPAKGVVIKVHYTGICRTDVFIWEGKFNLQQLNPDVKWPCILGHEISGEIQSIGPEAGDCGVTVGDRVAVFPWVGCGDCRACQHGYVNLCPQTLGTAIGMGVHGGFQRYMALKNTAHIMKIDRTPMDLACTLGCGGLTAYSACIRAKASVERAAKIMGEARLLIIGAGGLGLWSVCIARVIYPTNTKIIVADAHEEKLQAAKDLGADETMLWAKDGDEAAMTEQTKTASGGLDGVLDFVGQTHTLHVSYQSARNGASIVQVGCVGGVADFSLTELALRDITVSGVFVGSWEQMRELIQLCEEGRIKPPPLTRLLPDDVVEMFEKITTGKVTGRPVIQFH